MNPKTVYVLIGERRGVGPTCMSSDVRRKALFASIGLTLALFTVTAHAQCYSRSTDCSSGSNYSTSYGAYESSAAVAAAYQLQLAILQEQWRRREERIERMEEVRAAKQDRREKNRARLAVNSINITVQERAEKRLRLAEVFIRLGKTDVAERWIADLIVQYPETQAAADGHLLLTARFHQPLLASK